LSKRTSSIIIIAIKWGESTHFPGRNDPDSLNYVHEHRIFLSRCLVPRLILIRDSSAVWRLLWICYSRGTSESYAYGKQRICFSNSGSAHFHVSWLSDFIFYQKPLYKSLHQSFFYSFITILPSESGATLHYSTILP
jgi:hypothetical protein